MLLSGDFKVHWGDVDGLNFETESSIDFQLILDIL